jgi:hypothetical protein
MVDTVSIILTKSHNSIETLAMISNITIVVSLASIKVAVLKVAVPELFYED